MTCCRRPLGVGTPGAIFLVTSMLKNIKCPQCRKETTWEGNPDRPFCSERCRLIDLGAWASENYRIPGDKHAPDEDEET